jgi:D-sedoheptulose 7-phosphate isomerase
VSLASDLREHLTGSVAAVERVEVLLPTVERWGLHIAGVLGAGGRLLAAGNGGSAAEAQHLTAELVGRYRGERRPLSAISLHSETSSLTAIANDYGAEAAFARQVEAHGRAGDVLLAISTSGRSPNLLGAARRAQTVGVTCLALTGRGPNPLAELSSDPLCIDAASTAHVQEAHLVVVHLLCEVIDGVLPNPQEEPACLAVR